MEVQLEKKLEIKHLENQFGKTELEKQSFENEVWSTDLGKQVWETMLRKRRWKNDVRETIQAHWHWPNRTIFRPKYLICLVPRTGPLARSPNQNTSIFDHRTGTFVLSSS